MKLNTKEFEEKMRKPSPYMSVRLPLFVRGSANPAVLDKISVDYYGAPTPINQLATVSVTDARTLVIQPWDNSLLKTIDHAIQASDLGIMPQNDGKVIRITFPPLTEERRRELTKQVGRMGEDAKISIRNIRRDANDKAKEMKKKRRDDRG